MATNNKISVTDSSGGTASITARQGREEIILRNAGTNTVWLSRNEAATDSQGFYLESGDVLILGKEQAEAAWYMVCATGETATVYSIEE